VIAMGLAFMGVIPWFQREYRWMRVPKWGVIGAPGLGVLFGLGWTPCIGPTLTAVQSLALAEASALRGALLSFGYCIGLGIPFVAFAFFIERAARATDFMGTSHRKMPVKLVVAEMRNGIAELLRAPDGYEIVCGNGGSTGFWDAAVFGLIDEKSHHLSFGEFGGKFAKAVAMAPHLQDPSVTESAMGTRPGLWIAMMSPAAIARVERIANSGRYIPPSLNLWSAVENSRQDQTYNTPALATIFLTAQTVNWFNDNGGLSWSAGRSATSAEILYGWADASDAASPFVQVESERSKVVATIDFDESIDADTLVEVLRRNGILDVGGYRKLGRNQLRIGMFPAIDPADTEALTACLDYCIQAMS
ncbi:MAG: hypothetical protein EBY61_06075, partial [Actinobacteria bacterium]|nr:hypothetical protein [Actinomycetota bacterium]